MEMPMQHQIMGYDRTSAIFSPDGHLLQVEYAEKTVRLGSSSIGLVATDGVVIIADKRIKDRLMVPESSAKIFEIDSHIAATAAGILSDARVLLERAQLIAQQHRVTYDSPVDIESLVKEIANIKQAYSQYGGARPFGVALLFAGVEDETKSLFVTDVTGNYFGFKATAIGENDEKIKEMLRKDYRENFNIENCIKLSLDIFKKLLGKSFDINRFEAAYIDKDKKFKRLVGDELRRFLK
ncbi:MAG: archaeal proteasome endopeptidase complex subunit alpha [Candidatus Pacearchaeota archaeon]